MLLTAFGASIETLGSDRPRRRMEEWVPEINRTFLRTGAPAKVLAFFGHTGNFLLAAPEGTPLPAVREELERAAAARFAVVPAERAAELSAKVDQIPPPAFPEGFHPTPGLVLHVQGNVFAGPPRSSSLAVYQRLERDAVAAWKRDRMAVTAWGGSDDRQGGWGALSAEVSSTLGGAWTGRGLGTIRGLLREARL